MLAGESSPPLANPGPELVSKSRCQFQTISARLLGRERAGYIPRCSVVLCPDPHELVQVVRSQDRGVSSQILKIVHDDCHKQVEHLSERETGREEGEVGAEGKGDGEKMEDD